jgi:hypothetical protein
MRKVDGYISDDELNRFYGTICFGTVLKKTNIGRSPKPNFQSTFASILFSYLLLHLPNILFSVRCETKFDYEFLYSRGELKPCQPNFP